MNYRSLWFLVGLVVLCVATVSYSPEDVRAQNDSHTRDTEITKQLISVFPQPVPGIVSLEFENGRGDVIFLDESPAYFKSEENVQAMMADAMRKAFEAVPELERLRIIMPFEGHLNLSMSTRDGVEHRGEPHTVDVLKSTK